MKTRKELLEIFHDNHLSDLLRDEIVIGVLEGMDQNETITLEIPTEFGMPMLKKITVKERIETVKKDTETQKKTLKVIEEKLKEIVREK